MTDLLRSEWFKLRTLRLNYVLLLIGFAFVVVITGLIGIFADVGDFTTTSSSDIAEIVGGTSILAGLLISVIGVLTISSEFGHGTIRPTLVATPSRPKVFIAKAIVLAVLAFVSALVIGLAGYLVGYVLFSARGAEGLSLFDSDGTLTVILIGLPILFVLLTMFGYAVGLLIRNSAAAVTLAILWPILIETIIGTALAVGGVDEPGKFLPYQSSLALVSPDGADGFAYGRVGGGLFFGVVVFALLALAIAINNTRDV
ncbi:MAG: ABC transporter permease [Ilumatobacter sp.]|uniref:ABC transporter permease n=1 Tax=Ilumatobacter sp. TaxID=1967498 RepID=UPI003C706F2E